MTTNLEDRISLLLLEGAKELLKKAEKDLAQEKERIILLLNIDVHSTPPNNYWEKQHSAELKVTSIKEVIIALEEAIKG